MEEIILVIIAGYFVGGLFWGMISGFIYKDKGGSFEAGFVWGFFLGIIGVIIVSLQKDKSEKSKNSYSPTEELEKLSKLKESGALSEQEFEESKKTILSKL